MRTGASGQVNGIRASGRSSAHVLCRAGDMRVTQEVRLLRGGRSAGRYPAWRSGGPRASSQRYGTAGTAMPRCRFPGLVISPGSARRQIPALRSSPAPPQRAGIPAPARRHSHLRCQRKPSRQRKQRSDLSPPQASCYPNCRSLAKTREQDSRMNRGPRLRLRVARLRCPWLAAFHRGSGLPVRWSACPVRPWSGGPPPARKNDRSGQAAHRPARSHRA